MGENIVETLDDVAEQMFATPLIKKALETVTHVIGDPSSVEVDNDTEALRFYKRIMMEGRPAEILAHAFYGAMQTLLCVMTEVPERAKCLWCVQADPTTDCLDTAWANAE